VADINERAPDIDILSVQLYGAVITLPALMQEVGWEGALIVSEWGATGYWEVNQTTWGAPIEENSSVKADSFLTRYTSAIAPLKQQFIGSYVFLWGQKQERTSTWFGFFTQDGRKTEVLDVMHYLWNGQWPDHRSPRISQILLSEKEATDNVNLKAGQIYEAKVEVTQAENLTYRWEVLRESEATQSGGDLEEVPEEITGLIVGEHTSKVLMNAPKEQGAYRLYVYVEDQANYTAHANIPFFVEE